MPADLEKAYDGHEFLFLGPLLDKPGAKRAAGHKFDHPSSDGESSSEEEVLALARAAKAEGRLRMPSTTYRCHRTSSATLRFRRWTCFDLEWMFS
eukprot:g24706.t1